MDCPSLEALEKAIDDENCDELYTLRDISNVEFLRENYWQIIELVQTKLTSTNYQTHGELYDCCESFLELIVDSCDAKDVFLPLIGFLEDAKDHQKFITFLHYLENVLVNLYRVKNGLKWTYKAIIAFVRKLDPIHNEYYENEEKKLLDNDPNGIKLIAVYNAIFDMIDHVCLGVIRESGIYHLETACFLLELLAKPFASLYISTEMNDSKRLAIRYLKIVAKFINNPYALLEYVDKYESERPNASDVSEKFGDVALYNYSIYFFLIKLDIYEQNLPQVYEKTYIGFNFLKLSTHLLHETHYMTVEKALFLLEESLKLLNESKLDIKMLETELNCTFLDNVINFFIYCPGKKYRNQAFDLFRKYFELFDVKAKYYFIMNVFVQNNHDGLRSFLITVYKDLMCKELTEPASDNRIYFIGNKLRAITRKFITISADIDILQNFERILAALNFIRFLFIFDEHNQTKIKDWIPMIEVNFLQPLRTGLDMSIAHYEAVREDIATATKTGGQIQRDFQPVNLKNLPLKDQKQVVAMGLNNFDLIKSLLSRVVELIEGKS